MKNLKLDEALAQEIETLRSRCYPQMSFAETARLMLWRGIARTEAMKTEGKENE